MTEQPVKIVNPFTTIYDVTDQTPLDQVPPEYWKQKQAKKDEKEEAEKLKTEIELFSKNPECEKKLMEQAHTTISKFDDHIIRIVFHVGLSTYFKPLNLGLKAESGSGKSYSTVETLKFLPNEDIEEIGSQSPKVISHQNGIRKSKDGKILDEEKEPQKPLQKDFKDPTLGWGDAERKEFFEAEKLYKEQKAKWDKDIRESYYEVDLRNKTLVFLESVNLETFKMFKTTMSHDGEYIDHKYVDDRGTVHITRLIGAPAMIFNSVDSSYVEEFATRTLSATPSIRAEKIAESMDISNKKSAYPWDFETEPFNRKVIKEYIRKIKTYLKQGNIRVAVPFVDIKESFSNTAIRDMRDFNKFLELVPSYAIFKMFQRPIIMIAGKRYLLPTIQDAIDAKSTYDAILETTKTSTDYRVIEFYNTVVKNTKGLSAEDLTDRYNKEKKRPLSVKRIREWLKRLEDIGYVDIREATERNEKGYIDRRFNAYYPLKNAPNTAIVDFATDLKPILEKGFKKWLENTPIQTDVPPIILNIDGTANQITIEEIKDIIINNKKTGSNIDGTYSNPISIPIEENKPDNTPIQEIAVNGAFTKWLEYERIPRQGGRTCSSVDNGGYDCTLEAEYNLNGNLYCVECFKKRVKENAENGFGVREKERKEDA